MPSNCLSIVLPVFKTAYCLPQLYSRLSNVLNSLIGTDIEDYEIIFVDDCSPDDAWMQIKSIAEQDRRVRAFRLQENYGQHAAIATAMSKVRGDYAFIMDADMKDPPEVIPQFLESARQGNDVVMSVRNTISGSMFRRTCSFVVRRFFPLYRRIPNGLQYGTMSLLTRDAIAHYLKDGTRYRYLLRVLESIPLEIGFIRYNQIDPANKKSTYSIKKLVSLFSLLMPEQLVKSARNITTMLAVLGTVAMMIFALGTSQNDPPSAELLYSSMTLTVCMYAAAILCSWVYHLRFNSTLITKTEIAESVENKDIVAAEIS